MENNPLACVMILNYSLLIKKKKQETHRGTLLCFRNVLLYGFNTLIAFRLLRHVFVFAQIVCDILDNVSLHFAKTTIVIESCRLIKLQSVILHAVLITMACFYLCMWCKRNCCVELRSEIHYGHTHTGQYKSHNDSVKKNDSCVLQLCVRVCMRVCVFLQKLMFKI